MFGAWDPIPDNALTAARKAGVLDERDLAPIAEFLKAIEPMPAVFDNHYVDARINGANVKAEGKPNVSSAKRCARIFAISRLSMHSTGSSSCGVRRRRSISSPAPRTRLSPHSRRRWMTTTNQGPAVDALYAWAALMESVPFCNGAHESQPSTSPRLLEPRTKKGVPISGKDFKTGQTWLKTVIAPGIKARMLGLKGWYSTNILGNRDGEVLDDPASFKTKEESKLSVLHTILQPDKYPDLYKDFFARRADQSTQPRGDNKGVGQHR